MIVYHGTTRRRARLIRTDGFLPKEPSQRVWFAEDRSYALGRARTQAKRTRDRPVVLRCEVDLADLRRRWGGRRVFHGGHVIAVDAPVSAGVICDDLPPPARPRRGTALGRWVVNSLGLEAYRGVAAYRPRIERLIRWAENRLSRQRHGGITVRELLARAQHLLPEIFEGVDLASAAPRSRPPASAVEAQVEPPPRPTDPREEEALDCLLAESPKQRARGLAILAELGDPDLFDWCAMFLGDTSVEVTVAALHTVLCCRDADPRVIAPFAGSRNKRVRAAATAALAKHDGEHACYWLARGLKDPEPCVRAETAALLSEVDPATHQAIFELALNDPNPEIARRARELATPGGYARKWSWARPGKS